MQGRGHFHVRKLSICRAFRGRLGIVLLAYPLLTGCQQFQRIFYSPGQYTPAQAAPVDAVRSGTSVHLAAYAPAPVDDRPKAGATGTDASQGKFTSPRNGAGDDAATNGMSAATTNGVATVTTAPAYSAPQFALVPFIAVTGQFGRFNALADANVARVGAEALVTGAGGVTGRAGLTGPSATIGATLVSRPGLQEGPGTGLGFASPGRNVFTRQANPLSGPAGGCAQLNRAGFLGNNNSPCQRVRRR